ncbi:MAG: COX15/CtaA family protein, partial [Candidatus Eremiobacteraeota bacterium]|nr:COX15/CtaA family protein [Candidatus Eremiobacteraeota bacterium]
TMCLGAFVSSSGAGLACPSVPGCSTTFLAQTGPQTLQMIHRFFAAGVFVLGATGLMLLPATRRRAAATTRIAVILSAIQIALGVLNVLHEMPMALREAHAATAMATFLTFVVATAFTSLEAAGEPDFAAAPASASA